MLEAPRAVPPIVYGILALVSLAASLIFRRAAVDDGIAEVGIFLAEPVKDWFSQLTFWLGLILVAAAIAGHMVASATGRRWRSEPPGPHARAEDEP